ncbi:MAG: 30S ribosomal protein S13 [Candidatus Micrarchaeota archaeon]
MVKKTEKKPAVAKKPVKEEEKETFRGIVRIAGKDVKGEVSLKRALSAVRGINHTLAVAASAVLHKELSVDPDGRVGDLSEEQIDKIDNVLHNLQDYGVPKFLLNRRSDFASGKDRHVIMNDFLFEATQDLDREKKAYSWKGFRHTYGQKVRGQRTRNTGRTGMAVGVLRKAIIAAQGGAVAGAKPGAPAAGGAAPAAAGKAAAAPAGKAAAAPAAAKPAAKPAEKK